MAKRFTDTEKWKKQFFKGLTQGQMLFWNFINDDCDHAGVWYVDLEVAGIRIKEQIKLEEMIAAFNRDEERTILFDSGKKLLIKPFFYFQYGECLSEKNRLHNAALETLRKHGYAYFKGVITPLEQVKGKGTVKVKVKEKEGVVGGNGRFQRPTLEEVKLLFSEKGFPAEAEKFFGYYESNGWRVGKNPMKNWQAATANWLRHAKAYGTQGGVQKREVKPNQDCTACGGSGKLPDRPGKCWCVK